MKHQTHYLAGISIPLPQSISELIDHVRKQIRRRSALTGISIVTCVYFVVFWITSGLDYGWFAVQKLELPPGLRAIILAVILPTFAWLLVSRVLFPLLRSLPDQTIAVLIERRFPVFQDRLITAVEASTGLPDDGPLSADMLRRAVIEAEQVAGEVSPSDLFDNSPLRRTVFAAVILTLTVAGAELCFPGLLKQWWNAFIRCETGYHVRTTDLRVQVIAQPGDRRREFKETPDEYLYLHPRGADLELEMIVPDDDPASHRKWVVPERVRVDTIRTGGARSRVYVSPASSHSFRFVITRLQEPVSLELLAGDYRSLKPFRIVPVSLPDLDRVTLRCNYPEYTGWNQLRNRDLVVTGSDISLPEGTRFQLRADSSKPLVAVRIASDAFEISGDRNHTTLTAGSGESSAQQLPALISADGSQITATFEITAQQLARPADESAAETTTENTAAPADRNTNDSDVIRIPPNSTLKFFLHDEDDVISPVPQTLRVQGIADRPPTVVARPSGVENAVTRMARIPVAGTIQDDYGLMSAEFQFLVDDETNWRPRPFRQAVPKGSVEFSLIPEGPEANAVFDLTPLELSEGQMLTLAVSAQDGNSLTTPGISRSEPIALRVVSNEDLLSQLYLREITLRRRFEEVINQLEQVRTDLQIHNSQKGPSAADSTAKNQEAIAITTCATRSTDTLRRQNTELQSIAEGFSNIIQQLINNAVPPAQVAIEMREQILLPIQKVITLELPAAERTLGRFRAAAMEGEPTGELITESETDVAELVASLRQILEHVRDMAEFHEAIRDLKAILEEQQKIQDETKALQKRNLIDRLKLRK